MKLHKVPGGFVYGWCGRFGSGKSLSMTECALDFANSRKLSIVSVIKFNKRVLRKYCKRYKLDWLYHNLDKVFYVQNVYDLFFLDNDNRRKSLLILDEGGVEIFSRNFTKLDKRLYDAFVRIRHYKNVLFLACQNPGQIDKQFRNEIHFWMVCDSFAPYDEKLGFHAIVWRRNFLFNKFDFDDWLDNHQGSLFWPIWKSGFRFDFRPLSLFRKLGFICKESYLFRIYDSFDSFDPKRSKSHKVRSQVCKFYEADHLLLSLNIAEMFQIWLFLLPFSLFSISGVDQFILFYFKFAFVLSAKKDNYNHFSNVNSFESLFAYV